MTHVYINCRLNFQFQISSLLKHSGISLNQFQNISSNDIQDTSEGDIDFEMNDSFVIDHNLSKNEDAIICYVAVYIGMKMTKRVRCSSCASMFVTDVHLAEPESGEQFIKIMTRGGLKSPADTLFILLRCTYIVFVAIQASDKWFEFLRSFDPAAILMKLTENFLRSSSFSHILSLTCGQEHSFDFYFRRCVHSFFNCLAKNFVSTLLKEKSTGTLTKLKKLRSCK